MQEELTIVVEVEEDVHGASLYLILIVELVGLEDGPLEALLEPVW